VDNDRPTLEETIALLEGALESTRDAILIVDLSRRIIRYNTRYLNTFGFTAEELDQGGVNFINETLALQLEDPIAVLERSRQLWADPSIEAIDTIRFKDGRVFEQFIAPHRIGSTIVGRVASFRDISQAVRTEQALRQSQRMEAIGRLAGGVAHDLNNALTTIAGYSELALGELAAGHAARAAVDEVRRAAERATSVTRQLLAFSRQQVLEPRVFNLNDALANLSRLLDPIVGTDIELSAMTAGNISSIHADPRQVEQAIVNLALNACEAMPGGGRLEVATLMEDVDEAFARTHVPMPPGRYVVVSVSDTGHGMTHETQARIFEPFFTTKDAGKGTGLGLSMVYGTVKQSGGYIFVDSAPDRGTTFRLYFPPAAAADARTMAESTRKASAPDAPRPEVTLLIVEDEPAVRNLVAATLKTEGYRLLLAGSAEEAMLVAAEHTGAIDLLLTDAVMPGKSGIELANALVAERPGLPVIVMSGYTRETLDVTGLSHAVVLVHKPFTPRELRQRIREVLKR
jgi:two-component system, cell cycle sensor histidine kinase and response regulator CckA